MARLVAFRLEVAGDNTEDVEDRISEFAARVLALGGGAMSLDRTGFHIGPAIDEYGEPYVYGRVNYRLKGGTDNA